MRGLGGGEVVDRRNEHARGVTRRFSWGSSRAFTLVELLVVIGIIALLIAILLPALAKARFQSTFTVCAERERQLVMAMQMYSQENRGFFPRHDFNSGGNLWDIGAPFYDIFRTRYNIPHKVFFCPDVDPRLPDYLYKTYLPTFHRLGYSYWVPRKNQGSMIPPDPGPTYCSVYDTQIFRGPIHMGDRYAILNPMLTDSVVTDPNGNPNADLSRDPIALHVGENWTPHRWSRGTLGGMNEAWADGHVQRVAPGDVKVRYKGNFFNWR
jgi:prepilin-type N-terminal cleavage/methylation domain-containing protein